MEFLESDRTRTRRACAAAMSLVVAVLLAPVAGAEDADAHTQRATGRLVEMDLAGGAMVVSVDGRKTRFAIEAKGSVLTRTSATLNGAPSKLERIPVGAEVTVYWKPDAANSEIKRARKVDAPEVPAELLE